MENKLHHRQSIRLAGFDYSWPGVYFITIRTNHEDNFFGYLLGGKMFLNDFGQIVHDEWLKSMEIREEIILDEFVILPDHFHAIVWIIPNEMKRDLNMIVGANGHSPLRQQCMPKTLRPLNIEPNPFQMRPKSISSLITGFKSSTTTIINKIRNIHNISIWQCGFHDRIIRDEIELIEKRHYVLNNPTKHWMKLQQ